MLRKKKNLTKWITGAGQVCLISSVQESWYTQRELSAPPHQTQPYLGSAVRQRLQSERPTEQLNRVTETRRRRKSVRIRCHVTWTHCSQSTRFTVEATFTFSQPFSLVFLYFSAIWGSGLPKELQIANKEKTVPFIIYCAFWSETLKKHAPYRSSALSMRKLFFLLTLITAGYSSIRAE